MLETFTPYESFVFAAKLRTSLSDRRIYEKVDELVQRLGLKRCKDTMIGGITIKGISGGERKRTSIGYELITDPNLLLCDEPTSGLDSSTALRIVEMLKREARERNMTILCTIHQPSADIFTAFDRLLLLQEGHEIYQGNIKSEIQPYVEQHLQCKMKLYQNPADYLIKMAQAPHLCNKDLTLQIMVNQYRKVLFP